MDTWSGAYRPPAKDNGSDVAGLVVALWKHFAIASGSGRSRKGEQGGSERPKKDELGRYRRERWPGSVTLRVGPASNGRSGGPDDSGIGHVPSRSPRGLGARRETRGVAARPGPAGRR